MGSITFIEANIVSISPMFIGDDNKDILIDSENQRAYLPATGIAGAFRAYLSQNKNEVNRLFGQSENSQMSKIYIRDSFAKINNYDFRDGLRIDGETGSNLHGAKVERIYLSSGLRFTLNFEIHIDKQKDKDLIRLVYKALKGLDSKLLRLGGHKSSGLGLFKLEDAYKWEYNSEDTNDLYKYLKKDIEKKDILEKIQSSKVNIEYVEFKMTGKFTSPMIISAPRSFIPGEADRVSIKSGSNDYIIPGSSFKGLLRSRVETIANYYGDNSSGEIFGQLKEKDGNERNHILSRVLVQEAIIDNTDHRKDTLYNRIKLDKFLSGVNYGSKMDEKPVKGSTEFNIIYRKTGDIKYDNYAMGLITLALRDLGMENLSIGGNENIGRGRFKADTLNIKAGDNEIVVDFKNKNIKNKELLLEYITGVEKFISGGGSNG